MLLYSVLYLTGYDLTLDRYQQSANGAAATPDTPSSVTPRRGDDGTLGQGMVNAVGMAIAEAQLAALFTSPGHTIIDHTRISSRPERDLMEGVSHEACSLAGHLKLGK